MAARQDALTVLFSGSKALFALNAPRKGATESFRSATARTGTLTRAETVGGPSVPMAAGSMAVALLPSEDLQQLRARNVLTVFLGTDTTTTAPYFAADLLEKAEDEARACPGCPRDALAAVLSATL